VKIVIHGPLAGYGPDGTIHSWAPDTEVEVDDKDAKAVAWARGWGEGPHATLVEDVAKPKEPEKAAKPTASTSSRGRTDT